MTRPDETPAEAQERVLAELLGMIDEHGWAVRAVFHYEEDDPADFAYSVGFTAMGHPEVIITGLPQEHAHTFLNLIGDAVREGRRFAHGTTAGDLTDDGVVAFIRAQDTSGMTAVDQVYGRVDAVQMIWPDSADRFPWHAGYNNPPSAQPLLGEVPTPGTHPWPQPEDPPRG